MHRHPIVITMWLLLASAAHAQDFNHAAHMADMARQARQAEVARRGVDVMPFSLAATQHVFTKTANGGVQQVIVRDAADEPQRRLVRTHLQQLRTELLVGNFAGPAHIHGGDMPGLTQLQAAPPGNLSITYRDVPDGGELTYEATTPALVAAVHAWFDAQVSDHGRDAAAGLASHVAP